MYILCGRKYKNTVKLGYNIIKWSEYFVSLKTSVLVTEEYNIMINSEELVGTLET
jgi:hypothetical protein